MSEVLATPNTDVAVSSRLARPELVAFVADNDSMAALRTGLAEAGPPDFEIRRADVNAAIAILRKMPTPKTLIIDVSGEEQPLTALDRLSEVVEPDVRVLLVGDRDEVNFYRQVTRGLGILEYMPKPLQRDTVARLFGPLLTSRASLAQAVNGGRVVTITGVRGGVGASTLAANLAWYFGVESARHTVLLDADLHRGSCAMLLDAVPGTGLRAALETPQRIDELFVERTASMVRDRLFILAAEEKLSEQPGYADGASDRLLQELRRRYNFALIDLPFTGHPMHRDMLVLAHHRILVLEPTLACVRDTLRLMALPNGPMQPSGAVLVLNGLGQRGGLTQKQVEDALKVKVDLVVPDLAKSIGRAATTGAPAMAPRGPFRDAILKLGREITVLRTAPTGVAKPAPGHAGRSLFGRARAAKPSAAKPA